VEKSVLRTLSFSKNNHSKFKAICTISPKIKKQNCLFMGFSKIPKEQQNKQQSSYIDG
jgi:hypothetical protein